MDPWSLEPVEHPPRRNPSQAAPCFLAVPAQQEQADASAVHSYPPPTSNPALKATASLRLHVVERQHWDGEIGAHRTSHPVGRTSALCPKTRKECAQAEEVEIDMENLEPAHLFGGPHLKAAGLLSCVKTFATLLTPLSVHDPPQPLCNSSAPIPYPNGNEVVQPWQRNAFSLRESRRVDAHGSLCGRFARALSPPVAGLRWGGHHPQTPPRQRCLTAIL